MGNRKGLRQLCPPDAEFRFLGDDEIGIEVKASQIVADEDGAPLAKAGCTPLPGIATACAPTNTSPG
jgi:hypothetical protein